jgi:hypothetical protein
MKLSVTDANQADVASSPGLLLQRKCDCGNHTMGGGCGDCAKKKSSLQRKAASGIQSSGVPPIVHDVLGSPGQPFDSNTRAFFEPRFGHDFSHVRVHTDDKAAESARAVDALAYTVGRDIVFGTGQYRPATNEGRRLVGHELAHVLQQGRTGATVGPQAKLVIGGPADTAEQEAETMASRVTEGRSAQGHRPASAGVQSAGAGLLQRTPAPPTYGGATGTRDLSRIRIDAVPDFVASTLTAPRIVNAHINDPSVVHMTWMLYDPSDNMMSGSFSTLPGRPNATTAPFSLEPSHFSGAGFVQGKYLLRCVGLNATHQPVVYADRDFNVLSASLTTNTALPTTYGELTFTQYDSADANPPARPRYSVDVKLRFLPAATVTCPEVGFIQTMQTIDDTGRSQQNTVNPEQDARKTPLAWSVDRLAGTPTPFYGTEGTVGGAITMPPGKGAFGAGGPTPTPARLIDQASWNRVNNAKFETCVICRTGANRGQVYGCATWGYTANAANQVTLMPRGFRQMPSDQFEEARAAWNTWRTSVPAATRPEEAPALRSP